MKATAAHCTCQHISSRDESKGGGLTDEIVVPTSKSEHIATACGAVRLDDPGRGDVEYDEIHVGDVFDAVQDLVCCVLYRGKGRVVIGESDGSCGIPKRSIRIAT